MKNIFFSKFFHRSLQRLVRRNFEKFAPPEMGWWGSPTAKRLLPGAGFEGLVRSILRRRQRKSATDTDKYINA